MKRRNLLISVLSLAAALWLLSGACSPNSVCDHLDCWQSEKNGTIIKKGEICLSSGRCGVRSCDNHNDCEDNRLFCNPKGLCQPGQRPDVEPSLEAKPMEPGIPEPRAPDELVSVDADAGDQVPDVTEVSDAPDQTPDVPELTDDYEFVSDQMSVEVQVDSQCKPVVEICNDKDDDCDGKIDETFPQKGQFCFGITPCAEAGVWKCDGKGGLFCDAKEKFCEPKPEPSSEPTPEPVKERAPEPTIEPNTEPVPEMVVDAGPPDPVNEPVPEKTPEPVIETPADKGQPPLQTWVASLPLRDPVVRIGPQGLIYVVGTLKVNATVGTTQLKVTGVSDAALVILDDKKKILWAGRFGGSGEEVPTGAAVDTAGNVYVTGYFTGTSTIGTASKTAVGGVDFFLLKLSPQRKIVWAKYFGGKGVDVPWGGVAVDGLGNVFVSGQYNKELSFGATTLKPAGDYDIFVTKLDQNGKSVWAKSAGGTARDNARFTLVDSLGNVYLTGTYRGRSSFGSTRLFSVFGDDLYVTKLNSSGAFQWAAGTTSTGSTEGRSLAIDASGNLYVTGWFSQKVIAGSVTLSSAGGDDVFVAAVSGAGKFLWAKSAGGVGQDRGRGVSLDSGGNFYVAGSFQGTASFGSSSLVSAGGKDAFVAKYSTSGVLTKLSSGGGTADDEATDIAFNSFLFICGNTTGTSKFGGSSVTVGSGSFLWKQQP